MPPSELLILRRIQPRQLLRLRHFLRALRQPLRFRFFLHQLLRLFLQRQLLSLCPRFQPPRLLFLLLLSLSSIFLTSEQEEDRRRLRRRRKRKKKKKKKKKEVRKRFRKIRRRRRRKRINRIDTKSMDVAGFSVGSSGDSRGHHP